MTTMLWIQRPKRCAKRSPQGWICEKKAKYAALADHLGGYLDGHPAALWFVGFILGPLAVVCAVLAAAFLGSLPLLLF